MSYIALLHFPTLETCGEPWCICPPGRAYMKPFGTCWRAPLRVYHKMILLLEPYIAHHSTPSPMPSPLSPRPSPYNAQHPMLIQSNPALLSLNFHCAPNRAVRLLGLRPTLQIEEVEKHAKNYRSTLFPTNNDGAASHRSTSDKTDGPNPSMASRCLQHALGHN